MYNGWVVVDILHANRHRHTARHVRKPVVTRRRRELQRGGLLTVQSPTQSDHSAGTVNVERPGTALDMPATPANQ